MDDEAAAALVDDAESCCGSNYEAEERRACGGERKCDGGDDCAAARSSNSNSRLTCRGCGRVESCVLLLPCRHLCLCTVCGSSVHTCPVCDTPKDASLHVIMSSS